MLLHKNRCLKTMIFKIRTALYTRNVNYIWTINRKITAKLPRSTIIIKL